MQAVALPVQDQLGAAIERGRERIDDAQLGRRVRTATGRILRELPRPVARRQPSRRRPILVAVLVAITSAVGVAMLLVIAREWSSQFLAPGSAAHLGRKADQGRVAESDAGLDLLPDVEAPTVAFMTGQIAEMGIGPGLDF